MVILDDQALLCGLQRGAPSPSTPFVGAWKLTACCARSRSGRSRSLYGPNPQGRLFYDAAGNMAVQLMRSGRPLMNAASKAGADGDEIQVAWHGYESYFATYEVDWVHGQVFHRVLGALFPNWTGSVQARYFHFYGRDRLALSTQPFGLPDRTAVIVEWERLS